MNHRLQLCASAAAALCSYAVLCSALRGCGFHSALLPTLSSPLRYSTLRYCRLSCLRNQPRRYGYFAPAAAARQCTRSLGHVRPRRALRRLLLEPALLVPLVERGTPAHLVLDCTPWWLAGGAGHHRRRRRRPHRANRRGQKFFLHTPLQTLWGAPFSGGPSRTPNRFSHLRPPAHTLPPALQCPRGYYPRTSRSKIRPSDRWDVVATALHRCATLAVSGGAFLDASWGRQPRPVVSASWDLAAVAAGIATTALSRWCAAAAAAIAAIDLELGRLLAHVKKRTAHTGTGVIVFRSNSIYFRMSFPNQRVKRRHQHACLSSS